MFGNDPDDERTKSCEYPTSEEEVSKILTEYGAPDHHNSNSFQNFVSDSLSQSSKSGEMNNRAMFVGTASPHWNANKN